MHVPARTVLVGLVVLTAGLAGCAGLPDASQAASCEGEWSAYEDPEGRFALCHPPGWTTQEDLMGTDVTLYPSEEAQDDFASNANVVYRQMPEPRSAESVIQQQLPTLREVISGFELVSQGAADAGDREAYRITYTGEQGVHDLRWSQWALTDGEHLMLLSYATEQDEDPVGQQTLERMLASLTATG